MKPNKMKMKMKPNKMKPKGKRMFSGPKKPASRSIDVRGKWKPVELDPSLFSEGGLEGLVCFEELTSYGLVDAEKAGARAEKELEKKKKRLAKKRKANIEEEQEEGSEEEEEENGSEEEEDGSEEEEEKEEEEAMESSETEEPPMKKAKKKKQEVKESAQEDDISTDVTLEDGATDDGGGLKEKPAEDQNVPGKKKKKKKKKKNKKKQIEEENKEKLPDPETSSEVQAPEKETPQEVVETKAAPKQHKNWANAAMSGCDDKKADVGAWKDLFVPSPVLKALSHLGFGAPTPIQALALPSAIRDRMDVLGAAETGSGKTLAFGIPMIHNILEWKKGADIPTDEDKEAPPTQVESLYLPPVTPQNSEESVTEESVMEEANAEDEEDQSDSDDGEEKEDEDGEEEDERLGCVQVIKDAEFDLETEAKSAGGRNQPLLGLVLTPTRELAVQVKHHIDAVARFTDIKTAIMVGGMSQEKQRKVLKRRPEIIIATPGRLWDLIKEKHPHLLNLRQLRSLVIDEADRMVERGHFAELENLLELLNSVQFNPARQTFVFSATLTMVHSLPSRFLQKKKKNLDQRGKLEVLMEKVGIKSKPKIIDLTRKEATVETLTETRIHCQKEDKDFYLYYFLLQYPGRTMVFANSIDCIKRLNSLFVILDCQPLPLHANMHQTQRLKNLERFAERESSVLLTTDVAARGLDIPNVEHVIHYQIPRTSETYVHRSGRTARATKEGLSLLLIGPDDVLNFRKIYNTLGKDEEIPMFPIESKCMEAIKERVNLARAIEKIEFHNSREKQHNSWFKKAAEALEVDLDDELLLGRGKTEDDDREQKKMVKGMKKQLKHLCSQPVFKNLVKTRYPTQMGKLTLPQLPRAGMESALTKVTSQPKNNRESQGGRNQRQRRKKQKNREQQ